MRVLMLLLAVLLVACGQTAPDAGPDTAPTGAPNLPSTNSTTEVIAEMVPYHNGVEGYYARPSDDASYPGVVMIHEWWGLNDNIKAMAEQLAGEGYQVLAVDLYNGTVATSPDQARALTGSFNADEGLANMRSAISFLEEQGSSEVASLGWCFGGARSLQLGLAEDLDATVIYYGQLETDTQVLDAIEQPVLGIFGANDTSIPVSTVQEFNRSLEQVGVDQEIYIYPGVGHAFANPSGANYAAAEAQDAWQKTIAFLAEHLGE